MPIIQIKILRDAVTKELTITDEQYALIKDNVSFLKATMSEVDYCLMLRENIVAAIDDFKINGAGITNNFIRLNRYLMNWLNSFYAWIEHHEKHYNDLFGALKSKYYDSYFEYRFAYEMRKYTTHISLCISRITFDILNETTNYIIPINEILINKKYLNSKFAKELTERCSKDNEINLEDFTRRFFSAFEIFQREIWDNIIPDADKKYGELLSYIEPFLDKTITRYYIHDNDNGITDISLALKGYREKRTLLSLPDEYKPYLR